MDAGRPRNRLSFEGEGIVVGLGKAELQRSGQSHDMLGSGYNRNW